MHRKKGALLCDDVTLMEYVEQIFGFTPSGIVVQPMYYKASGNGKEHLFRFAKSLVAKGSA